MTSESMFDAASPRGSRMMMSDRPAASPTRICALRRAVPSVDSGSTITMTRHGCSRETASETSIALSTSIMSGTQISSVKTRLRAADPRSSRSSTIREATSADVVFFKVIITGASRNDRHRPACRARTGDPTCPAHRVRAGPGSPRMTGLDRGSSTRPRPRAGAGIGERS